MYAIVRCGGRQEKASVDDVLTVDRLAGEVGSTLTLPALLVVDGDQVVSDPEELGSYEVSAEIVGPATGLKINMIRYKNKTGYRRRLGHRQKYTQVKITGIGRQGQAAKATAAKAPRTADGRTAKASAAGKASGTSRTSKATKAEAGEKA